MQAYRYRQDSKSCEIPTCICPFKSHAGLLGALVLGGMDDFALEVAVFVVDGFDRGGLAVLAFFTAADLVILVLTIDGLATMTLVGLVGRVVLARFTAGPFCINDYKINVLICR